MNYKISQSILIIIFLCYDFNAFCQGKVTRPTQQQSQTSKPQKSRPKETISEPDGYINGHGYVDLGLPSGLKWATCNVGASSPFDYGDYFAWGEITPKSKYTQDNSKTYKKQIDDISGNPDYDAAQNIWGASWRIPTKTEWQELIDKCKWVWTTINNRHGYLVTGANDNSIFIPAGGNYNASVNFDQEFGCYWSSTPYKYNDGAYSLWSHENKQRLEPFQRQFGQTIRPVTNQ